MSTTRAKTSTPRRTRHAKAVTTPGPFSLTVDISRRYDATRQAYKAGVLSKGEWDERKAVLDRELNDAVTRELDHIGTLGPLGVTIGTTVVVSGELIESAWGNQVRADLLALNTGKFESAGGTITGTVVLLTPTVGLRLKRTDGSDAPILDFYNEATTTRFGYVQGQSGLMKLSSDAALSFHSNDTERGRLTGTAFLYGKTASNLENAGCEVGGTGSTSLGSMRSTIDTTGIQNFAARHVSSADADGIAYAQYSRTGGTVLGSVTQVSTTGVAYNTTSQRSLKTDRGQITDALGMLRKRAPRLASFKGVKDAPVELVWFADDWLDLPGVTAGKPGAKVTAAMAKANGYGKAGDPIPLQMDYSRTTPLIGAAVLELEDRIAKLEKAAK